MQTSSTSLLTQAILNSIDNGESGIRNPSNWPSEAVMGVSYICHDKQFPEVKHELETRYFASVEEFNSWKLKKEEWIEGTDYDFSVNYSLYTWDWGPVFQAFGQL